MATIEFNCGSCGQHYKVPVATAGRKAKCKACGGAMQIPALGGQVDEGIELREVEPPVARRAGESRPRRAAEGQKPRPAGQRKSAGQPKNGGVDLSALYAGSEEPVVDESPLDELAAASGSGFDFGAAKPGGGRNRPTRKKKSSGPPMALLVGAGGGGLLLLVIVVVLVVVLGGGDDEPEAKTGIAITENKRPSSTGTSSGTSGFSLADPGTADPEAENEGTPAPVDEPEVEEVEPELVDRPEDSELVDWTVRVDPAVAEAARQISRAGLVFTAPTTWSERSRPEESEGPQIRDSVALSPDESIEVSVIVGKYGSTRAPDWPTLLTIAKAPADYTADELIYGKPMPFRGPHEFMLVPDFVKEPVSFGTLLGGYRFARFALGGTGSDNAQVQVVHYLGTIGSLYVHITVTGKGADAAAMAEAEWIARSARLMTESGLASFARKSPLFQDWLKERNTTVPRVDDLPPVASATPADWPGFAEGSAFKEMMSMAGASGPVRSPYRIAPPDGLEPAASSRRAVRWQPNEQGLWMAMEVVDLGSRWRRTKSPLLGSDRAMVAGREMDLPAGTETSEFEVNGMKVFRILPPESPAMDSREVFYITLDRGVLVTVLGRYAKDRPDDLTKLDAAVRTLGKR